MNPDLLPQIKASFGFDPVESAHHFLVEIRRAADEPVYISEHISWDDQVGSSASTLDNRLDGQLRVILPRKKWDAIADEVRVSFNLRLRNQKLQAGQWRLGPNLLRRELGKELTLLAWALEDADSPLAPAALANWKGLVPEERWWLYTQTAATTGHATQGRNIGWRKAVRYALTENPTLQNQNRPPEYFLRALNNGQAANFESDLPATQSNFLDAPETAPGQATSAPLPKKGSANNNPPQEHAE